MNILLTGAGFSRNWGGWLASEAFEYLLGAPEVDDELRRMLWADKLKGNGFEDTLGDLQQKFHSYKDARIGTMLEALTAALVGMFNQMDQGFADVTFEPQNIRQYLIGEFLARFDAIFTLNQDLLMERHYLNDNIMLSDCRKWSGWQRPGLKPLGPPPLSHNRADANLAVQTPDSSSFRVAGGLQPYFKLHGSSNFVRDPGGRILVMGGNKALGINQEPLLKWYHDQFVDYLGRAARLMVIGYSFSDRHINDAIIAAAMQNGLDLFIVDPEGVDVLDKNSGKPGIRVISPLIEHLGAHVVGASRRPLSSTFASDRVEHAKLIRFVTG